MKFEIESEYEITDSLGKISKHHCQSNVDEIKAIPNIKKHRILFRRKVLISKGVYKKMPIGKMSKFTLSWNSRGITIFDIKVLLILILIEPLLSIPRNYI